MGVELFMSIEKRGPRPNAVTFVGVLTAYGKIKIFGVTLMGIQPQNLWYYIDGQIDAWQAACQIWCGCSMQNLEPKIICLKLLLLKWLFDRAFPWDCWRWLDRIQTCQFTVVFFISLLDGIEVSWRLVYTTRLLMVNRFQDNNIHRRCFFGCSVPSWLIK